MIIMIMMVLLVNSFVDGLVVNDKMVYRVSTG